MNLHACILFGALFLSQNMKADFQINGHLPDLGEDRTQLSGEMRDEDNLRQQPGTLLRLVSTAKGLSGDAYKGLAFGQQSLLIRFVCSTCSPFLVLGISISYPRVSCGPSPASKYRLTCIKLQGYDLASCCLHAVFQVIGRRLLQR